MKCIVSGVQPPPPPPTPEHAMIPRERERDEQGQMAGEQQLYQQEIRGNRLANSNFINKGPEVQPVGEEQLYKQETRGSRIATSNFINKRPGVTGWQTATLLTTDW